MGTKLINLHIVILNIYMEYTKHKVQNSASAKGQQTNKKIGDTQWKETTLCQQRIHAWNSKIHVYKYKETHLPIQ